MTRHLLYWSRIWRLGSEHIFGVCVVTFDTWHLAILFDLVQGIMLASQGKVLSPGNVGYMAVLRSPAVGKVSKPRRGHPLVEFVIVAETGRKKEIDKGD